MTAERDRLRQTVIDAEKRCIELLQERDGLVEALELALSALDNSLRSAGTSTAGFIATRKLMAKAQTQGRAVLSEARKS